MSSATKIPVWTWRDAIRQSPAPPLTKHICNCVAYYLSDAGKGCWPTQKELLKDTGLGNKAFAKHLQSAVNFGLLHVSRARGKDGRLGRYIYHPRFPDDVELSRQAPAEGDGVQVSEEHVARPDVRETPGPDVSETDVQVSEGHLKYLRRKIPKKEKGGAHERERPQTDGRRCTFENGRVHLHGELRAEWLKLFDGDSVALDLALVQASAYLQPNSVVRCLEVQVSSQLARYVREERGRATRSEAATAQGHAADAMRGRRPASMTKHERRIADSAEHRRVLHGPRRTIDVTPTVVQHESLTLEAPR